MWIAFVIRRTGYHYFCFVLFQKCFVGKFVRMQKNFWFFIMFFCAVSSSYFKKNFNVTIWMDQSCAFRTRVFSIKAPTFELCWKIICQTILLRRTAVWINLVAILRVWKCEAEVTMSNEAEICVVLGSLHALWFPFLDFQRTFGERQNLWNSSSFAFVCCTKLRWPDTALIVGRYCS